MVRNYKRKTNDRWTKTDLLEALVAIKDSKLKINDAAREYGISRATLYRQYQKFMRGGAKMNADQFRTCGGNPILTRVEEEVLERTIKDLRSEGIPVTSIDIKRICFEYCDTNGVPNQFRMDRRLASDDWYYGFLKRHPAIKLPKQGRLSSDTVGKRTSKGKRSTTPETEGLPEINVEISADELADTTKRSRMSPTTQLDSIKEEYQENEDTDEEE